MIEWRIITSAPADASQAASVNSSAKGLENISIRQIFSARKFWDFMNFAKLTTESIEGLPAIGTAELKGSVVQGIRRQRRPEFRTRRDVGLGAANQTAAQRSKAKGRNREVANQKCSSPVGSSGRETEETTRD